MLPIPLRRMRRELVSRERAHRIAQQLLFFVEAHGRQDGRGAAAVATGAGRLMIQTPLITIAAPTSIGTVICSSSSNAPSAIAATGTRLMNTAARADPSRCTPSRNQTNATAVPNEPMYTSDVHAPTDTFGTARSPRVSEMIASITVPASDA